MRGHFDVDNTAYPIGYLSGLNGHFVTDMRNLHTLHEQAISKQDAVRIAALANADIRAGALSLRDNDTSVAEFVKRNVEGL